MAHHFMLLRLSCFDLRVIERDGDLSILCHNWEFACQQSVLKVFLGPGYLRSEDQLA